MKIIYVTVKYRGSYSDKEFEVEYAGLDYEQAKGLGIKSSLNSDGSIDKEVTDVCVQHWKDGECIKTEKLENTIQSNFK